MAQNIIERDISEDARSSYLEYSLDVIIGRALPDVRDGCKPVHRRILYSMWDTGNTSKSPYKKSARTVGEVLGKYHPHGDSSVYEAMVRFAQDFVMRCPFVDGHGNFGSVDGDSAAAMRYTEARMSKISEIMMEDINCDTVDMMDNYDGSLKEPRVLPSRIPNMLVNGTEGIAVGYASKMPPHNLSEALEGVIATIDNPEITTSELMKYIKAPDFPTGGIILGLDGVRDLYETGVGTIKIQAKYDIEDVEHSNSRKQIVFTEIPYMVNKAELVIAMNNLVIDKALNDVEEIRDESSTKDGMRIVVELKKTANPTAIIKTLFKRTKLQANFPAKNYALVPTKNDRLKPKLLTLKDIIQHFIKHRKNVITRKYQFLLAKAEARLHILDGLIKAVNIIDDVVALIRSCKNPVDAQDGLMKKFQFSEKQAKAILDFKLQRLTGLEIDKLKDEEESVKKSVETYKDILSTDENILKEVKRDCQDVLDKYGDERRSEIMSRYVESDEPEDVFADVEEQEVVIVLTNTGYIKRVPLAEYTQQARGGKGSKGINTKNIDAITKLFTSNTKRMLLCFGSDGRMYKLPVPEIPEDTKLARGKYLNTIIGAGTDVTIVAITEVDESKEYGYILMFSKMGGIKKIKAVDLITKRRAINAITIKDGDELVNVCHVGESEKVFIATGLGMIICFDHKAVSAHGRSAGTVRGIKLSPNDYVVSADILPDGGSLLTTTNIGLGKRTKNEVYNIQSHGGKGSINCKLKPNERIVSVVDISDDKDIIVACSNGKMIRIPADSVKEVQRVSRGVRMVDLNTANNEEVVTVSSAIREDDDVDGDDG